MKTKPNRTQQQITASVRRRERQEAHEALMAQHAKHRAENERQLAAHWDWWDRDCIGPMPVVR